MLEGEHLLGRKVMDAISGIKYIRLRQRASLGYYRNSIGDYITAGLTLVGTILVMTCSADQKAASTAPETAVSAKNIAGDSRLYVRSWCGDDENGKSEPVVEVSHNLKDLRRANGESALLLVFNESMESRVLGILNEFGDEDSPWQYRKTFTPRGTYSNVGPDFKVQAGASVTFEAYWAEITSYQNKRVPIFNGKITAVTETVATCSNTNSK